MIDKIKKAIELSIESSSFPVALHEPCFDYKEHIYVRDCIKTGWVSSAGEYVDRFENMLVEYTGAKYAIATVNGTSALHMCYVLAGVQAGDEVIVQDLTFVGTVNPIIYCNAIPHFADIKNDYLGICPDKLEEHLNEIAFLRDGECINKLSGKKIKALVAMHTFGRPSDIDSLLEICNKHGIILIEDSAQSLGSFYKNIHTGTFGRISALSFNGNKIITTGGGGAILTNDPLLAQYAKHITTTAKLSHPYEFAHDRIGYNYRMPNINAALGCAQLSKIDDFVKRKRKLAKDYDDNFKNIEGIKFLSEPDNTKSNYWLNSIILDKAMENQRDGIIKNLIKTGYLVRPAWRLMHTLPMFMDYPKMDLSNAERMVKRIINLPSSVFLSKYYKPMNL